MLLVTASLAGTAENVMTLQWYLTKALYVGASSSSAHYFTKTDHFSFIVGSPECKDHILNIIYTLLLHVQNSDSILSKCVDK